MIDPSRSAPVKPGELLAGKYRVEHVLGVGGMGVVVAATHTQLEKRVALKFMLPSALDNKEAVERFLREARSAVQLTSEHVARVLDVGTLESGAPYIVMELLHGQTLEAVLYERGPLPVGEAVEYVVQVCEAVAEAHARNIIHRDLKPANMFLTRRTDKNPLVKVLDFGLSKVLGPGARKITQDLAVMGTPEYMSPEQLRGAKDIDTRTDIWSLGVILYELVAGQTPFQAESLAEVCSLVLNAPPRPLFELAPDAPEGLAEVIEGCLQKAPAERYPDVAALAEALEPFVPRGTVRPGARIRQVQFASVAPPKWSRITASDAPDPASSAPTLLDVVDRAEAQTPARPILDAPPILDAAPTVRKTSTSWSDELRPRRSMRSWSALAAFGVVALASLYVLGVRTAARDASVQPGTNGTPTSAPGLSAPSALVQTAAPSAAASTPDAGLVTSGPAAAARPAASAASTASARSVASVTSATPAPTRAARPIVPAARPRTSRDKLLDSR